MRRWLLLEPLTVVAVADGIVRFIIRPVLVLGQLEA